MVQDRAIVTIEELLCTLLNCTIFSDLDPNYPKPPKFPHFVFLLISL